MFSVCPSHGFHFHRVTNTGPAYSGPEGMLRDQDAGYPVASPHHPTRHHHPAGDEKVFPCLHKFKHLAAKMYRVPLQVPPSAAYGKRET
jgi:hypothetical protein